MTDKSVSKQSLKNLFMSVGSIVAFNMVIQFFLYPFMERRLGHDAYGVALSLISLVGITSISLGSSANYSRMMTESRYKPANSNYVFVLLLGGILCSVIGGIYLYTLGIFSWLTFLLFSLLIISTAFRYYSDVNFRLGGDFFGYMIFYLLIAVGYVIGAGVYALTGEWMLAIILGELVGIAFVAVFGNIYKKALSRPDESMPRVLRSMGFLLSSSFMENLTLNADRLILLAFCDGETVAIFYTASLLGKAIAMLSSPLNSLIISYLVRGNVSLTKKFWWLALGGAFGLGTLAFAACAAVSPFVLRILYPSLWELARPYIVPAILSQIFYFIAGMLLVVLLKFNGEKRQFLINAVYGAEFFILVIVGTALGGLGGFVTASLVANLLRFLGVALLGFWAVRQRKQENII